MITMFRLTGRLRLASSLLEGHSRHIAFVPSSYYRLDSDSTTATAVRLSTSESTLLASRSSTFPRPFLRVTNSCRNYGSFPDDSNSSSVFYPHSQEYPATGRSRRYDDENEGRWKEFRPKRPSSLSQRHRQPRDFDFEPDFRQNRRMTNRDEDGDDNDSHKFIDRFKSGELGANIKKKNWNTLTLSSIEKNFYVQHQDVTERSAEEVEDYYSKYNITVSQGERPVPLSDFHEANFPEKIVRYLESNDWSNPTPIQSLGWPIALSGKNMVGLAQTGSGKTLGFILPALVHIKHQRPVDKGEGPIVLVLAPTRELAQQIKGVAVEYGRLLGIQSCSIFGGQSKLVQAKHISQGPELVVATPGRLLDFLESEVVDLDRTTYVVLDEADRMLDMGFEPQIRKVLNQIRPDRQILMWSATWPEEIQQLAHDFLGDFTQINIGSQDLTANPNIEQVVKVCEWREKFGLLLDELQEQFNSSEDKRMPKTLIFAKTKRSADVLSNKLWSRRLKSDVIHGDKSQLSRDQALHRFRNGRTDILVATDVAARGLDVDDIKVVINYDYPNTIDDYIHRIGRTARASKTGRAVTFLTNDDAGQVKDLISTLKSAEQHVDSELYDLASLAAMFRKKSSPKHRPNFQQRRPPRFTNDRHRRDRFDSWES